MTDAPTPYEWTDDGSWKPLPRFRKRCDAEFAIGERAILVKHEERSMNSHRHFFAEVHNLWETLPEDMGERFPNDKILRKWALIKAGFCNMTDYVASSKAEAERARKLAEQVAAAQADGYAIAIRRDCVVTVYTAKSQSIKAMGRADFQASKDAVFRVISELIGVDPATLARESGKAA